MQKILNKLIKPKLLSTKLKIFCVMVFGKQTFKQNFNKTRNWHLLVNFGLFTQDWKKVVLVKDKAWCLCSV